MVLSRWKDGRAHFRNSGMKGLATNGRVSSVERDITVHEQIKQNETAHYENTPIKIY